MTGLLLGLLTGVAFGFILQRSRASGCGCVINTLELRDTTVLKLMLVAVGVGAMLIYPLSAFGVIHFAVKPTFVLGNLIGGLIFGLGFAVAGYCPGTALAALGEGKKDVLWAVAGGLLGAFAYAAVYGRLKPYLIDRLAFGKLTLPQLVGVNPIPLGVVFGAAMIGVAVWLDRIDARRSEQAEARRSAA